MNNDYHETDAEDDGRVSSDIIKTVSKEFKDATVEREKKGWICICLYHPEVLRISLENTLVLNDLAC